MVMYLEKDLIDSVRIEKEKISQPGYLSRHTRKLREKHASLLLDAVAEPKFLLYPATNTKSNEESNPLQRRRNINGVG